MTIAYTRPRYSVQNVATWSAHKRVHVRSTHLPISLGSGSSAVRVSPRRGGCSMSGLNRAPLTMNGSSPWTNVSAVTKMSCWTDKWTTAPRHLTCLAVMTSYHLGSFPGSLPGLYPMVPRGDDRENEVMRVDVAAAGMRMVEHGDAVEAVVQEGYARSAVNFNLVTHVRLRSTRVECQQ